MEGLLLDTNVMIRYLLDDIEEMALTAELLMEGNSWTTPEALAEVEYVLRDIYDLSRKDVHSALHIIFDRVDFEHPDVVELAIEEYKNTNLDFVDCMLIGYEKAGFSRVFTFDKGIRKRLELA